MRGSTYIVGATLMAGAAVAMWVSRPPPSFEIEKGTFVRQWSETEWEINCSGPCGMDQITLACPDPLHVSEDTIDFGSRFTVQVQCPERSS